MKYRYTKYIPYKNLEILKVGTTYKIFYIGRYIYEIYDFEGNKLCNITLKTLNYCFEKLY